MKKLADHAFYVHGGGAEYAVKAARPRPGEQGESLPCSNYAQALERSIKWSQDSAPWPSLASSS